jgi:hypothetical protein
MLFDKKEIQLLEGLIPRFEKVKPSFVSVLKANSETNITNFLAYLFKGEDFSQLQEIFLDAFIDEVASKSDDEDYVYELIDDGYNDITVTPEYITKFGRIDILIVKESNKSSERRAIIVENKLYHELNNDFDDYFYSVCEQENIKPDNIIVVVLSLKEFTRAFPNYMKTCKVTHKELKVRVEGYINTTRSILNDKSASLLANEYLMHIDDLYLERAVYSHEKCFEFYSENRKIINSIVTKVNGLSFEEFETQDPKDKKILFDSKDKIEHIVQLQKAMSIYALDTFNHYVKLTERSVQGKDYFRGKGLVFEAIRYNLKFKDHFISEKPIELEVSLNGEFLSENKININDSKYQTVLTSLRVSFPINVSKNSWFIIKTTKYEIDETILSSIFKDNIENEWGKLEELLADSIKVSLIEKFNEKVIAFLNLQVGCEHKIIEEGSTVQFSYTTTERFYQYTLRLIPPDLIEIVLYVENNFWDDIESELKIKEKFIKFTQAQSYRISEAIQVDFGGTYINYDAILKKSYRIKSLDEVEALFENEKLVWTEVEKSLVQIIESSNS